MVLTVSDSTHTLEHVHLYPLFVGIDRSRVEDMENRLKQDVLREAAQYNNQILVAHENDDFQVIEQWEAVTEVDVQTPLEVYRELSGKCHHLPSSHEHHALSVALGSSCHQQDNTAVSMYFCAQAKMHGVPIAQCETCICR